MNLLSTSPPCQKETGRGFSLKKMEEESSSPVEKKLPAQILTGFFHGHSTDSRVCLLICLPLPEKCSLTCCPHKKQIQKMGATTSPLCKLCKQFTGSLKHELFDCSHNNNIGHQLLHTVQTSQTSLNTEALLYLEFADLQPDMQLPITLLTSVTLSCIWTSRRISSTVRSYHVRSELEQTINLLRTTRHSAAAGKMSNILNQMFQ